MTIHHTDFISTLYAERANILSAQGLLSKRLVALDDLLAVYTKPDAAMRPQTVPATMPVASASAGQAAVESPATHPSASRNGVDGTSEGQGATGAGTEGATPSTGPRSPDLSITISAKTSASAPGSEVAASDAVAASAGEVASPVASPAPDSAEAPTDETGTASSSEPIPMYSRAGHIGTWVRGDEKAPDPAPAGGAATSPPPSWQPIAWTSP